MEKRHAHQRQAEQDEIDRNAKQVDRVGGRPRDRRRRCLADQAVRALAALGRVAPAGTGFRADYPTAAITGQAAVEFPKTRTVREIMELLVYFNTSMQEHING